MAAKANAAWVTLNQTMVRPGSTLTLGIKRLPPGTRLGAEFKVELIKSKDDSVQDSKITKLSLVAGTEAVTVGSETVKRVKKLDPESSFDGNALPTEAPDDEPWLKVVCCVRINKRWMAIPNAVAHVPGLWSDLDDDMDLEDDTRVRVTIQLYRGTGDAFEETLGAPRSFELASRRMTLSKKLEAFLAWQSTLVYGPGAHRFKRGAYACSKRLWDELGGTTEENLFARVSSSGETPHAMVCSPFVGAFLGYWFNYHERYPARGGKSSETLAISYEPFISKVAATCSQDHEIKWSKPGELSKKKIKEAKEEKTVDELNALSEAKREVGTGRKKKMRIGPATSSSFKVKGATAKLRRGLQAPKKRKLTDGDAVQAGDIIMWSPKKKRWVLLHRNKGFQCCSQKAGGDFHWRAFYDYLETEREANRLVPGDFFVCASGYHARLVAYLGDGCNVPRRYIFGDDISNPDDECEPGYYVIEANGPGPTPVLYEKFRHVGTLAKAERRLMTRLPGDPTKAGAPLNEVLAGYKDKKDTVVSEIAGVVAEKGKRKVVVTSPTGESKTYRIPKGRSLVVADGANVTEGQALTDGELVTSPMGVTYDEIFDNLDPKRQEIVDGFTARSTALKADYQAIGLRVFNGTKLPFMNGHVRLPEDSEKGAAGNQVVIDSGINPKSGKADFIRKLDPKTTEPTGFAVWRVASALITDASTGNLGWVAPDHPLDGAEGLREHDCRPLINVD